MTLLIVLAVPFVVSVAVAAGLPAACWLADRRGGGPRC